MDVSTLQRLDANILLGIINEKLRLECDGLEELLAYYDMTEDRPYEQSVQGTWLIEIKGCSDGGILFIT